MKSMFFPCHMCGSYDSEVLTPAFLADGSACDFQKIVICKKCGLIYKNPVIPALNKLAYSKTSWGNGSQFKKRISDLNLFLSGFLKEQSPKMIIEIGPGPGWLVMSLQKSLPNTRFILFEASEDVAKLTKDNLPKAIVVPASIEEVHIKNDFADLALVCGVDYLFADFYSGFKKIYDAISAGGHLYIERNVFVETDAYAGFPIRSYWDLFGQNVLMTTWFNAKQYKRFLETFFDIVSERSFLHDETDGQKCIIQGFLCRKKNAAGEYYKGGGSWYETNISSLARLSKNDPVQEPPVKQVSQSYLEKFKNRLFRR